MADVAASSIVPAIQPPQFASPELQHLLDEAMLALLERGHHAVVQRVILFLGQRQFHDAMRLLNEQPSNGDGASLYLGTDTAALHEFHSRLDDSVHMMLDLDAGYDETFRVFRVLVLVAARETAGFRDYGDLERYAYGNDGGFRTAPAAVVAALERRIFHAGGNGGGGGTECSICFEDFVDGGEVSVMPCPSLGHQFHPGCIVKWLGISNMCPLCRHVLVSSAPAAASTMVAAETDEPDRVIIDEEESTARRDERMTTVGRRSSSRRRRPNVRTSGPEWVRH